MSNTALQRITQAVLANKSGGAVAQGDVVVVDLTTASSFTTTTTAGFLDGVIGVVIEPNGIANNAVGMVAFSGPVPKVNLSGSASLGDLFKTHTVAKQAVRHAAGIQAGDFGIVLATGTTPPALLWGLPAGATGAGTGDFSGPGSSTAGHMVTFADGTGKVGADGGKPGMVKLAETMLGSSAANFDFDSISGAYSHLKIFLQGRSDAATNEVDVHMKLNNDSGNNYDAVFSNVINTTVSGSNVVAGASNYIGHITAASATANFAGGTEITIYNYARTTLYKNYASVTGSISTAAANILIRMGAGQWRSTAAITRVTLTPSSGNFIAGSVATLYGLT